MFSVRGLILSEFSSSLSTEPTSTGFCAGWPLSNPHWTRTISAWRRSLQSSCGFRTLTDFLARARLEAEDRLTKFERGGEVLARAGWDPDKHPRVGAPPNPGWFAPTEGTSPEGSARESEAPIVPVAERSTGNPDYAARALRMDRNVLSKILHEMKKDAGLAGDDNVRITIPSGDVYFGS